MPKGEQDLLDTNCHQRQQNQAAAIQWGCRWHLLVDRQQLECSSWLGSSP